MFMTHMFWAGGDLSRLETACIRSFLRLEYDLTLWTYDNVPNAPEGVSLRNAAEVLPRGMLFKNRRGSYAGFSDLFRYAVLSKFGGLWSDTDVIAVAGVTDLPREKFLVTEYMGDRSGIAINGNIIFNPDPHGGDLIDLALAYSSRFDGKNIEWSEIGPDLLTSFASIFPGHGFGIMEPAFANPICYTDFPSAGLTPGFDLSTPSAFVHLYNERWRAEGIDKNRPFPAGSLMDIAARGALAASKTGYRTFPGDTRISKARFDLCPVPQSLPPAPPALKQIASFFLTMGRTLRIQRSSALGEWLWRAGENQSWR